MSEKYKELLINLAIGVFVVVFVYWLDAGRGYPFLHCLSDGFFVAAVLLLGVGGLRGVRNKGAFDVVGFGVSSVAKTTFPFLKGEKEESIYEYRERKAEQRKGAGGLLAAGAIYLVLSILVLCLYYMIPS